MTTLPVRNEPYDPGFQMVYGPLALDRRSRGSRLTELAGGLLDFTSAETAEPSTLPYEELLYGR